MFVLLKLQIHLCWSFCWWESCFLWRRLSESNSNWDTPCPSLVSEHRRILRYITNLTLICYILYPLVTVLHWFALRQRLISVYSPVYALYPRGGMGDVETYHNVLGSVHTRLRCCSLHLLKTLDTFWQVKAFNFEILMMISIFSTGYKYTHTHLYISNIDSFF